MKKLSIDYRNYYLILGTCTCILRYGLLWWHDLQYCTIMAVIICYMYIVQLWLWSCATCTLYNHGCYYMLHVHCTIMAVIVCYMYIVQYCTIMAVIVCNMHIVQLWLWSYAICTLYNCDCNHIYIYICYM